MKPRVFGSPGTDKGGYGLWLSRSGIHSEFSKRPQQVEGLPAGFLPVIIITVDNDNDSVVKSTVDKYLCFYDLKTAAPKRGNFRGSVDNMSTICRSLVHQPLVLFGRRG